MSVKRDMAAGRESGVGPDAASCEPAAACEPAARGLAAACEPLTEELLARLLASTTPEEYLVEAGVGERDLPAYLRRLLDHKGIGRAEAIRACGINPTFGYQVFQGTRRPSRDNVLVLSFGMGCTLHETQRLLRVAGYSELYCKVRRDAIVLFCVEHGYTRFECDDELFRLGEETLAAPRRHPGD